MEYTEEQYLLLSGIQHFVFCRRQWALIHIEQQWAENYQTTAGELMNKKPHALFGYDGKWNPVPIEYKHGTVKENIADEAQLCAQAVCLEEMFQTDIPEGYLYYGENHRRHHVEFTEDLRNDVKKLCKEMHELFQKGHTPNVKYSKQCKACSLENLCLPRLQKAPDVRTYIEQSIHNRD